MRRFVKFAAAVSLLATPVVASAQAAENTSFFKAPVFVLQPGGVTSGAISAPEGVESSTAFNARFATVLPTSVSWFQGVFGAQVATGGNAGTPNIFYGGIFPIVPISTATGGMLGVSLDPLGVTTFGGNGSASGGRGTTFFFGELAVSLAVGKMMFSGMGPMWSGLGAYFLVDQQLSDLPRDANGDRDRWGPVLLYGLNIPLGFGK